MSVDNVQSNKVACQPFKIIHAHQKMFICVQTHLFSFRASLGPEKAQHLLIQQPTCSQPVYFIVTFRHVHHLTQDLLLDRGRDKYILKIR